MDSLQILILALVQGLTEFLPISSSAHLILTPMLLGYQDQGLAFDVAVHLGSLLAVTTYFRHELIAMARDFFLSLRKGARQTENSRMVWMIILATLPIVVAGELFISLVEHDLRSTSVIATTTILFGILLFWYDRKGNQSRDEYSASWRDALIIGGFQVLALIPGTSRSGITMTAGLMLGLTREAASRFSFFLSIPTILMSGSMVTLELISNPAPVNWLAMGSGALLSFASAYICIHYFLQLINKISMLPFVIYRLLLGGVLVWVSL
ncbi:MAG: undecaprenyl-diphosphate phosphatase [Sedimenticola sp.]|uniref:Undecaprenyl-diphosphatase n=1 Tax=Sedimenticola thiotaurini TaxID=1543721 RepID=A0A558CKZ0_9GAMM|nr:undecaprenyl-diphosphate phosphatase [Sedimenticola sp.]MCW8946895.1 undecaprenyl-diphosphate phosphatase [Sedimenticola sp.]MCW8976755.1 undecaprenyl-diphosphate phosphatase [Sedimenticola sp.]MCW9022889.1 undecaprenyl-diphosphate phosphatase [Sedimenticola sp.]TVT49439.1 MAG: undecaprenyl-diphosphate phosphatase [Sedimenticola thiotaurini]